MGRRVWNAKGVTPFFGASTDARTAWGIICKSVAVYACNATVRVPVVSHANSPELLVVVFHIRVPVLEPAAAPPRRL